MTPVQLTSQNAADLCRSAPDIAVGCHRLFMIISMISQSRILIQLVVGRQRRGIFAASPASSIRARRTWHTSMHCLLDGLRSLKQTEKALV